MDNLRFALVIIGVFIIIFIYVLTRLQKQDEEEVPDLHHSGKNKDKTKEVDVLLQSTGEQEVEEIPSLNPHTSDTLGEDLPAFNASSHAEEIVGVSDTTTTDNDSLHDGHLPPDKDKPENVEDLMVILTVVLKNANTIRGDQLVKIIEKQHLFLDQRGIFQYLVQQDNTEKKQELFVLVNILEPGTFDRDKLESIQTSGVILLLQLPGVMGGVDAFELMWEVAENLAIELDAKVCDEKRQSFDPRKLTQLKNTITRHAFEVEKALYQQQVN